MAGLHRESPSTRQLPYLVVLVLVLAAVGTAGLARGTHLDWDIASFVGACATALALVGLYAWYRRAREDEDRAAMHDAQLKSLDQPATLHPIIDPDICMGSLSCISVC